MRKINKLSLVRYYSIPICLSAITFIFGQSLLFPQANVVNRVILFPPGTDDIIGVLMMGLAVGKVVSLLFFNKVMQRIFLIGIAICWLLIGWSYFNNMVANTGHIMAWGLAALCYVELWRGDFSG
ncbi:hypothetical protein [Bacillus licheniformis]|uniref:hypothetical protein n=1 Tax=Bacillus licheniformis TaxID=1402 RepID=UPI0011A46AC5|nr:hypothetical protein [Bacillus licheniformis]